MSAIWPRIRQFLNRKLVKSVLVVISGAGVAQLISILVSMVVTRTYGPEAIGQLGVFASLSGIAGVAATGGYAAAIVQASDRREAAVVARLSLVVAGAVALTCAAALALGGSASLLRLGSSLQLELVLLLPLAIMVAALGRTLSQWLYRHGAFGVSARATVLSVLVAGGGKLAFIPIYTSGLVLVAMNLAGAAIGSLASWLIWRRWDNDRSNGTVPSASVSLLDAARKFSDFPKWRLPQDLINTASQSLPLILLGTLFGAGAAGYYSIAATALTMPSSLIGQSVGSVLYPRITQVVQAREDATPLIWRATRGLAVLGVWPYALVAFAGPWLFGAVFGDGWEQAGRYAQWLSPWLFLQLLNQPAVSAIPALGLQRGLLIYEVFSTAGKLLALWVGFVFLSSDLAAVALFSVAGVVAYVALILWVVHHSKAKYQARIRDDHD